MSLLRRMAFAGLELVMAVVTTAIEALAPEPHFAVPPVEEDEEDDGIPPAVAGEMRRTVIDPKQPAVANAVGAPMRRPFLPILRMRCPGCRSVSRHGIPMGLWYRDGQMGIRVFDSNRTGIAAQDAWSRGIEIVPLQGVVGDDQEAEDEEDEEGSAT